MKDLPPEAKQMMDSLGYKIPDAKSIPSSKQLSGMQTKITEIPVSYTHLDVYKRQVI